MKRVLVSISAFLLASTAATAFAGGVRLHAGVGVGGNIGLAQSSRTNAGTINPALHVDLGARLAPNASVYVRGEAGTIILGSEAAAYLVAEWQATRRLSLATGIGVDAMVTAQFSSSSASASAMNSDWLGPSIPLIAGFELWHAGTHAVRLDLEGAVGVDAASTVGWHSALSLEWVWN